jgi:hypothetical protein
MTVGRIAWATGCSISPTRITHLFRVARHDFQTASRPRIAACRYSGVCSQYFDTTVTFITALNCAECYIIKTFNRGLREHS